METITASLVRQTVLPVHLKQEFALHAMLPSQLILQTTPANAKLANT